MQTTTQRFEDRAQSTMQPLSWRTLMSFPKSFLEDVDFFTIGVSTIGGGDIIKGEGDVIQEWDKYQYDDYSYRIHSIEVTRQEEDVNSVALAIADIEMENHDNYFTPNGGSIIDEFILPYRPTKLFMGFGAENVPVFVGLTEKMPTVDEKTKRVKFHLIDFMYSLFNRPLDESLMLQDVRTDEALEELMDLAGITPTQYDFDTGFNIIDFVYFEKGTKFGDAVKELMEAEMGRFYMDETGIIRFKNRQNYSDVPVWHFDKSNVIGIKTRTQDEIINVVEIKADVREVQANQKFWELQSTTRVPANSSLDIWADFEDPVTDCDDPEYILTATTSLYATNTEEDGSGTPVSADFALSSSFLFAQSYKMTFQNDNDFDVFITALELFATPAKVVKKIYVREEDTESVAKYDERVLTIENNFINNEGDATSKAKILLGDYSEYGGINELVVIGNPAIQIGDAVSCSIDGFAGTYVISKIVTKLVGAQLIQTLTVKLKNVQTYFTIGISTIGGVDVIAP
jgi:hypothetical protein